MKLTLTVLTINFFIFIIADLGIVSEYDGAIITIVFSALFPKYTIFLIILIASLQSVPGMGGMAWYVGFTGTALILNTYAYTHHKLKLSKEATIAIMIILFTLSMSIIFDNMGGSKQSVDRNPFVIATLSIFMIITSNSFINIVMSNYKFYSHLIVTSGLFIIAHTFFVGLFQTIFGATFLAPKSSLDLIHESAQFNTITDIGISRIHGTFLSSNAFSLYLLLLSTLVFLLIKKQKKIYVYFWISFSLLISVMAISKALVIFSFFSSAYLIYLNSGKIKFILFPLFLLLASFGSLYLFNNYQEEIIASFRINNELQGNSYRRQVWDLIINNFSWDNWVFGTGFSYWPDFFEKNLGFRLSDPHSWPLSITGTFGITGLFFYLYIAKKLFKEANKNNYIAIKFVAMFLFLLLVVKDAFSIPYLLGNTPFTFLIWVMLLSVLNLKFRSSFKYTV